MKKILFSTAIILTIITFAVAATWDGKWAGKYEAKYDVTLNLVVKGQVVTGMIMVADNSPVSENPDESEVSPFIASQMGENSILNGKLVGEELSFSTNFNGTIIPFKGKMDGEKLVLTATFKGQEIRTGLRRAN